MWPHIIMCKVYENKKLPISNTGLKILSDEILSDSEWRSSERNKFFLNQFWCGEFCRINDLDDCGNKRENTFWLTEQNKRHCSENTINSNSINCLKTFRNFASSKYCKSVTYLNRWLEVLLLRNNTIREEKLQVFLIFRKCPSFSRTFISGKILTRYKEISFNISLIVGKSLEK